MTYEEQMTVPVGTVIEIPWSQIEGVGKLHVLGISPNTLIQVEKCPDGTFKNVPSGRGGVRPMRPEDRYKEFKWHVILWAPWESDRIER